ncbi:hypothetical protein [Mycolicibacterium palauense]|uniref:hypothetical protein n=1 Tax=Mycolicibacterium palauense TaxID=2034511 RepID=UPI000BFEAD04|nr:hypothetical protein [Mycolicibacterium palauense]
MTDAPQGCQGCRGSRAPRVAGLLLTAAGLSHFVKPGIYEPLTTAAFPTRTRQYVYINGGIETALGLGLLSRRTRRFSLVGILGYLGYLGANAARNAG